MRKCLFFSLVLWPHIALAQISHGTSLVFDFSKDEVVVAADSVMTKINAITKIPQPDDSYCKIMAFKSQLVFTETGNTGWSDHTGWDGLALAKDAVDAMPKREMNDAFMDAIAQKWADDVSDRWVSLYRLQPSTVSQLSTTNQNTLTSGIFIGADHGQFYVRAIRVSTTIPSLVHPKPIQWVMGHELGKCFSCGQKPGIEVCPGGVHIDIAAQFCSTRKAQSKITIRTPLRKANNNARLAVKIVELTIDAYGKTPGDVGGEVDVLTLKKDGTITWNHRKTNCPESQE